MTAMTGSGATTQELGLAMPAEWAPHELTLMAWPVRAELWGDTLAEAKDEYAAVARAIAAFEPVLMVVPPGSAAEVRDVCGAGVETLELELDDSWMRDSGPIFVTATDGRRAGVDFRFNGWGEKFVPYDRDDAMNRALLAWLRIDRLEADLVRQGVILAQTVEDAADPNHEPMAENLERLRAATDARGRRLEVIEVDLLPRTTVRGSTGVVPYVNLYLADGVVVVPTCGDDPDRDAEVLGRLRSLYAPREVVGVPARALAEGGGGVHCITQQVPSTP